MKIAILGGISISTSAALIIALQARHEVVVIDSVDDVNTDNSDILICEDDESILFCGHPELNIGSYPECYRVDIPQRDNTFRGGSRGKGGKIKYKRG